MSYSFEFRPGYVVVTVEGSITPDEEVEAFRSLISSPQFESGTSILLDNRLRSSDADRTHLHTMADEFLAALKAKKIPRFAMVAQRTLSFGIGALFETIAAKRDLPLQVRTFAVMENAEEWLEEASQTRP